MRKFVFNATRAIYGAFFCAILIIVTFCAGITYACNRDHFIPNCVPLLFIAAVFAVCFAVSRLKRDPLKEKSAPNFDRAVLAATVVLAVKATPEAMDRLQQAKKNKKEAAEKDGAEVIVLGCAGMAGYADVVRSDLGMEVIDPSSLALKVTEALVAAGMKQSKRGYYSYPPCMCR